MKFLKNKWVLLIVLLALVAPIVFLHQNSEEHAKLLKTVLDLKVLPASVKEVQCEKWGQSRLLITCYFEYDHADLDQLMGHREFDMIENPSGSSFDDAVSGGPTLGREFKVAYGWLAKKGLKESDWVRLHTDSNKGQAVTDIFLD